jgi:hypothetical protein
MDITDQAGFPHRIYRGLIDDQRLFSALVVKTAWTVADGRITLDAVQEWPVLDAPKATPAGLVPSDQCFYKAGADVMVIGKAGSAKPVERMTVSVAIGNDFRASVLAIGRRTWRKRLLRGLEISPAEPFTSMPLTLHEAFGGKVLWDDLPIPFPDNPDGMGYYIDAAGAEGKPLPLIEDPQHLITKWDDRPEPVGLGLRPLAFGPHVRRAVTVDARGEITKLDPLFFNHAFPACVARDLVAGQTVTVTGILPGVEWSFALPACPLRAEVMLGSATHDLGLRYDQIWLEPATGKVLIAWRAPFRYHLRPLERRRVTLERIADGLRHTSAVLQPVGSPAGSGAQR